MAETAIIPALLLLCATTMAQAATRGEAVYAEHCTACHQSGGVGTPGLAPPLFNTLGTQLGSPDAVQYLSRLVVAGMVGRITVQGEPYNGAMPAFASLSDADLAAVLGYVIEDLNAAVKPAGYVAPSGEDIAKARAAAPKPNDVWRLRQQLMGAK